MRLLRNPALHFMAIGVTLFAVSSRAPQKRPTVVVTAAHLAQLRAEFGKSAPPADRVLVERAVDEEILLREAVARGLDRDDPAIRWRVAEKMRFLKEGETEDTPTESADLYREAVALGLDQGDAIVRGTLVEQMRLLLKRSEEDQRPPSEAELLAYFKQHQDRYLQPARVSFSQVFLANDRRGAAIDRDALELLVRLKGQNLPPAEAVRLGDRFAGGAHFRAQSAQDLTRMFGSEFASVALAQEAGSWSGPIRSAYGLHLIRVEESVATRAPALEAVRSRVLVRRLQELQEARLAEAMRALRAKYDVRVETAAVGRSG